MDFSQDFIKYLPKNYSNSMIKQFKRFYLIENANINQILKEFNINQENVFNDPNSKKIINKINDKILSNSSQYLKNYFLYKYTQTTNENKILKNQQLTLKLLEIDQQEIIKDPKINRKINFPYQVYTIDKGVSTYFYEKYQLQIIEIKQSDIEEMLSLEEKFILITDEDLLIDIEIFSKIDFEKVLQGNIILNNKELIIQLLKINYNPEIFKTVSEFLENKFDINIDKEKLLEQINKDVKEKLKNIENYIINLESLINEFNEELKIEIANKSINLQGEELIKLLQSADISNISKKISENQKEIIQKKEKEIIDYLKENKIKTLKIFENYSYPVKIANQTKEELLQDLEEKKISYILNYYKELGKTKLEEIEKIIDLNYILELSLKFKEFYSKIYTKANISKELYLEESINKFIENSTPISYGINTNKLDLNYENVSVLTGANSGGKTTLLELILQNQYLFQIGLLNPCKGASLKIFDQVIYLKKFSGTQGSGAFEQTLKALIEIISSDKEKLILIDEFEAITEPGAAARILTQFLKEISKTKSFAIAVSHLGNEIKEFIEKNNIQNIRIDGISATGLDDKGNLLTNHQPQFYQLGKSTPDLIMKRILNDEKFWKDKTSQSKETFRKITL